MRTSTLLALLVAAGGHRQVTDAAPYLGTPFACTKSCAITAGQFDTGGEGSAYHDTYNAPTPHYRAGTTVNVDANNAISYLASGEWYEYSVKSGGGTFSIVYSMAAKPPAPVPLTVFATLDNSCATATPMGLYKDTAFTTAGAVKPLYGGRVTLPSGTAALRICFKTVSYARFTGFSLAAVTGPYEGVAASLPGTVDATRFDTGGQGVAYSVSSTPDQPRVRAGEAVAGSATALGYLGGGEWFKYTVNVKSGASFNVAYMLAGDPPTGVPLAMYLAVDKGCDPAARAAPFSDATWNANSWTDAKAYGASAAVWMATGRHVVTLCIDKASYVNVYGIRFSSGTAAPTTAKPVVNNTPGTPYNGQRQAVAGTILADRFDTGGEGVAYHELSDPGFPVVRAGDKVNGGGGVIGYIESGEWVRYSVQIAAGGMYGVRYMLAGAPAAGVALRFQLALDTNNCDAAPIAVMTTSHFGTGDWNTYAAHGAGDVWLPGGGHTLTVCFKQAQSVNFKSVVIGAQGSGNMGVPAFVAPGGTGVAGGGGTVVGGGGGGGGTNTGGWVQKWGDEFNGGTVDLNKWQYSIGNACNLGYCGWGNNEQQSYQQSAVYMQNGNLVLEARKEYSNDGSPYISGKIVSRAEKGFNVLYGRVEARINFPKGQGFWPSIWMLPDQYLSPGPYGNWPGSGEIDIVEVINQADNVFTSLHYGATGNHDFQSCAYGGNWGNAYHTYAVEWAPWGQMKYYVDGQLVCSFNKWWCGAGAFPAPFNKPFYVILNFAVGGSWPGGVDNNLFANGQRYKALYDYVRVYEWPAARRLSPTGQFEVPDGWTIPQGWDVEAGAWEEGFDTSAYYGAGGDNTATGDAPPPPAPPSGGDAVAYNAPEWGGEGGGDEPLPQFDATLTGHIVTAGTTATATACAPTPYSLDRAGAPSPWPLPADAGSRLTLGAEYFDDGPAGCAYGDADAATNRGNCALREGTGVDLVSYDGAANGPYVGHMAPGEWLSYTVESPADALYSVQVVATSPPGTGVFRIVVDSANCADPESDGGAVLVPDRAVAASAATAWRFYGTTAPLAAGVHQLVLCAVAGSLNVDYMRFERVNAGGADAGEGSGTGGGGAAPVYSGPAVPRCVSHSCHDAGVDKAMTKAAQDEGIVFDVSP